jgi:hypothetical protein
VFPKPTRSQQLQIDYVLVINGTESTTEVTHYWMEQYNYIWWNEKDWEGSSLALFQGAVMAFTVEVNENHKKLVRITNAKSQIWTRNLVHTSQPLEWRLLDLPAVTGTQVQLIVCLTFNLSMAVGYLPVQVTSPTWQLWNVTGWKSKQFTYTTTDTVYPYWSFV